MIQFMEDIRRFTRWSIGWGIKHGCTNSQITEVRKESFALLADVQIAYDYISDFPHEMKNISVWEEQDVRDMMEFLPLILDLPPKAQQEAWEIWTKYLWGRIQLTTRIGLGWAAIGLPLILWEDGPKVFGLDRYPALYDFLMTRISSLNDAGKTIQEVMQTAN